MGSKQTLKTIVLRFIFGHITWGNKKKKSLKHSCRHLGKLCCFRTLPILILDGTQDGLGAFPISLRKLPAALIGAAGTARTALLPHSSAPFTAAHPISASLRAQRRRTAATLPKWRRGRAPPRYGGSGGVAWARRPLRCARRRDLSARTGRRAAPHVMQVTVPGLAAALARPRVWRRGRG